MVKKNIYKILLIIILLFVLFYFGDFLKFGNNKALNSWTLTISKEPVFHFFNSNFFNSAVTFTVGFLAWLIYKRQKDDFKKDAGNIILQELQNAEILLKAAKKSLSQQFPVLPNDFLTMQSESWSKYKYLFVGDFDRIQWDIITDFYNRCQLYDEAVGLNNSFTEKNQEQLRTNIQKVASDYVIKNELKITSSTGEQLEKIKKEIKDKNKKFMEVYLTTSEPYWPQGPILLAKSAIDNLNTDLTLSSIGIKLKKLSNLKE